MPDRWSSPYSKDFYEQVDQEIEYLISGRVEGKMKTIGVKINEKLIELIKRKLDVNETMSDFLKSAIVKELKSRLIARLTVETLATEIDAIKKSVDDLEVV